MDALGRRLLCADDGACLHSFLALDSEADQCADHGAELDRLVFRQVAEVLDLEVALGVLVDGQRVDHPHRVALAQPLELRDDLAVELRVLEAQHDELNRSNRHLAPSVSTRLRSVAAILGSPRERGIIRLG